MSKTKDGGEDFRHQSNVTLARHALDPRSGGTCGRREADGLLDGKGREVDIVFRAILNIATIVFIDVLRSVGVIVHGTVNGVVF